ncbi:36.4 kDa proline-rich protein-like isoform X2 [Phragmites australis]|uniref:36.4 kDa proline-rich protein-like isoform X2 n=1 Tax=Phragmites australis TaxID=29695 RepID=UPI002D786A2A|nr:36.4 kDa proline-rich protein-like isoform X2 [Phragmites australis]
MATFTSVRVLLVLAAVVLPSSLAWNCPPPAPGGHGQPWYPPPGRGSGAGHNPPHHGKPPKHRPNPPSKCPPCNPPYAPPKPPPPPYVPPTPPYVPPTPPYVPPTPPYVPPTPPYVPPTPPYVPPTPPYVPPTPPYVPPTPPYVPPTPPYVPPTPPYVPPTPPYVPPTPPNVPPTPPNVPPTPPAGRTCPINALKLNACVDVLGGLIHLVIGREAKSKCCPLVQGVADLDAALCLCTTIRARVLNINIYLPIALELLITCGKHPPAGFKCPSLYD